MKKDSIIIDLKIQDKKYFTSKYNNEVIDPELSSYIMSYMIGNSLESDVIFNINTSFELNDNDKEKYTGIIKREFSENIDELEEEFRKSNIKKVLLSIIGILSLLVSYFLEESLNEIFSQVFVIFGWVALWEVSYGILFENAKRNRLLKRYKQLYNAKFNYNNKE